MNCENTRRCWPRLHRLWWPARPGGLKPTPPRRIDPGCKKLQPARAMGTPPKNRLDAPIRSPHLRRRPVFHRAFAGASRHVALLCNHGSETESHVLRQLTEPRPRGAVDGRPFLLTLAKHSLPGPDGRTRNSVEGCRGVELRNRSFAQCPLGRALKRASAAAA